MCSNLLANPWSTPMPRNCGLNKCISYVLRFFLNPFSAVNPCQGSRIKWKRCRSCACRWVVALNTFNRFHQLLPLVVKMCGLPTAALESGLTGAKGDIKTQTDRKRSESVRKHLYVANSVERCAFFPRFTGGASHASLKVCSVRTQPFALSHVREIWLLEMKHKPSPVRCINAGSGEFKLPLVVKTAGSDWFRHEHLCFQLVGCSLPWESTFFFFL